MTLFETPFNFTRFTRPLTVAALVASLTLGACQNMNMTDTEKHTAEGGAIGALAGAVISSATGGRATTGALVGGLAGAAIGNVWSRNMEKQKRQMEQATQGTGVEVSKTADNQLKLNIPSDISFDSGSATIKPQLRSVLDQFATGLNGQNNTIVRVVGHTDSQGGDAINDPLSLQRANAVRNYLNDRGVSANRIETVGRGSHEPVADNSTAAGRAQNRRVEIFLREPSAS